MHCYFHARNATAHIADDEGIEVANLDQARAEALAALRELRNEDGAAQVPWQKWSLEVTDSAGAVLLSIRLDADLQ